MKSRLTRARIELLRRKFQGEGGEIVYRGSAGGSPSKVFEGPRTTNNIGGGVENPVDGRGELRSFSGGFAG